MFDEAVVAALATISLDEETVAWVRDALRDSHEDQKRYSDAAVARLQARHDKLKRRIDAAYEDRLDGRIDAAFFDAKAGEWRSEQSRIQREIANHQSADQANVHHGVALLELAGRAVALYEAQDPAEKRRLLSFVLSNCVWTSGQLTVNWRKPFDILAESIAESKKKTPPGGDSEGRHPVWLRR